jgi:hypothetical protein
MIRRCSVLFSVLALVLVTGGCAKDPVSQLSDAVVRKSILDALVADPAMRQEVVERIVGAAGDRAPILDRLLKDDAATGEIVQRILADDRGKALVASKVAADDAGAKTFIRMLMLTGVMGASVTQKQADAFGMGEAFAQGNRRRTMTDLKRIGRAIDGWAKEHEGRYPVCGGDLAEVRYCLARSLPAASLDGLRLSDAWGAPLQYKSDREGTEYVLLSYATDGQWDGMGKIGPTDAYDCDIVFSNGDFIQWPGALRKTDIK